MTDDHDDVSARDERIRREAGSIYGRHDDGRPREWQRCEPRDLEPPGEPLWILPSLRALEIAAETTFQEAAAGYYFKFKCPPMYGHYRQSEPVPPEVAEQYDRLIEGWGRDGTGSES